MGEVRPTPRNDLAAERSALGAVMLDPSTLPLLIALAPPDDFYHPAHALILRAMQALDSRREPIDGVTLAAELGGRLNGDGKILAMLEHAVGTASNIEDHARIVARLARSRRIYAAASRTAARALDPAITSDELESDALASIADATRHREIREASTMVNLAVKFYDKLEAISRAEAEHGSRILGLPTGLALLDSATGGLHPGQFIVIAARPSMGKTSFAQKLIRACAEKTKKPALMFSLEMLEDEVFERMACDEAGLDALEIRRGRVTQEVLSAIAPANATLAELPIMVDDDGRVTINDIRARAIRAHSRTPLGLIVLDYLQKIRSTGRHRGDSRDREVTEIAQGLKELAKELRVPVVALSQLNRDCEDRPDKRPALSDLRESGGIEQEADVALLLYRAAYYSKLRRAWNENVAEIDIAKQRGGTTDTLVVGFNRVLTRFYDLSPNEMQMFQDGREGDRGPRGRRGSKPTPTHWQDTNAE